MAVALLSWTTVGAEDQANEALLSQGMQQFREDNRDAARATLLQVDPSKLSNEQRATLNETLRALGVEPQPPADAPPADAQPPAPKPVTPADLILQAERARSQGNYQQADALLQRAAEHEDITDQEADVIAAQRAELARLQNARITAARQTIDQIESNLRGPAPDYDAAQRRLAGIKRSVDLGFFDNRRVDRLLARVAEEKGRLAAANQPADNQPADVRPADNQPADNQPADNQPADNQPADNQPADNQPADVQPADAQPAAGANGNDDVLVNARQLLVQEKVAQAQQAEANGNYRVAVRLYEDALALDPGNDEITQLRNAAANQAAQAGPALAPTDPLNDLRIESDITAEAARVQFNELMDKAHELRAQRQFDDAQQAIQQAKVVIDQRAQVLGPTSYNQLRDEANELYAAIAAEQRQRLGDEAVEQQAQDAAAAEARRREAIQEQYEQVQRLLRRALELRKMQDYEGALQLVNQALFLDPNNAGAQAMKIMLEDSAVLVEAREYMRLRELRIAKHEMELIEATVPYNELMTYPSDWPELTAMRLAGLAQDGGDSEINRRVSLKLDDPLPVNFEANRLVNVIDYFRNTTGVNFFVNWAALEAAGIEQDMPITLQLNNIPAEQALKLVLQQVGGGGAALEPIEFSIIDGVVHISTRRELTKTTDTRVYDIRDLLVQIPRFTGAPEFDLNSALSNTSSGGSAGGAAQASTQLFGEGDEVDVPDREESIEQITTLIQDTIGRQEEWAAYGGEVSSLRELNGNLIVKSTPDNHREIIALLGQLRAARAIQIHIESRFLLVDSNYLEEIGVDLDLQINVDDDDFPLPIGIAQDSFTQVNRSGSGFPGSFGSPDSGFFNSHPSLFPREDGPAGFQPGSGFPSNSRALDFGVTFLSDVNVFLLIKATQANRRSISLTAPRLTLFNGQRSHVMVARQIAFISDLEPVSGGIGFDPTLSVTQSGVVLDVEATVSADRRYVTMTARPSLATVVQPLRSIPQIGAGNLGGGGVGDDDDDEVVLSGFIEAPELELTSVRTSVSVPDKGTLLMGGQRLAAETELEVGVPILSKIPVINRFFTNRVRQKDQRTLLILIKPTIIIQEEQEEALWPGLNQDPTGYSTNRQFNPTRGVGEITGAGP